MGRVSVPRDRAAAQFARARDELTSFVTHPGVGRILSLCPHDHRPRAVEHLLEKAGYRIGRLPITSDPQDLPEAAGTFQPDLIFVMMAQPEAHCLAVLETLAVDPRTQAAPVVTLLAHDAPTSIINEAYSRAGCDFFRLGSTDVELLARTHLLVRLARANAQGHPIALHHRPVAQAANDTPAGERLDLYDLVTGTYSKTYFMHRLPIEISRSRRYHRALALMAVRVPKASEAPEHAVAAARIIRERVRTVDLVARLDDGLFLVLLPETALANTAGLCERMERDFLESGWACGVGAAGLDAVGGGYTPIDFVEAALAQAKTPALDAP